MHLYISISNMQELIEKLGLNWKLLLAQGVNFLLILVILRFTLYKPLVRILRERRERIAKGLQDAEDAATRLQKVDAERKEKLADAERESLRILAEFEGQAKRKEEELMRQARAKESEILKTADRVAAAKTAEAEAKVFAEAAGLVKSAVAKTAQLEPTAIDESLIAEALRGLKKAS